MMLYIISFYWLGLVAREEAPLMAFTVHLGPLASMHVMFYFNISMLVAAGKGKKSGKKD